MKHFVKDIKLIDKFFPICGGVYLHNKFSTTYSSHTILNDNLRAHAHLINYGNGISGILAPVDDANIVVGIILSYGATMPSEWKNLGLNWDISYKNLWLLMKRLGFENIIETAPHYYFSGGDQRFKADFISVAPDDSFLIKYNFEYRQGGSIFDNNTLWGIQIQ